MPISMHFPARQEEQACGKSRWQSLVTAPFKVWRPRAFAWRRECRFSCTNRTTFSARPSPTSTTCCSTQRVAWVLGSPCSTRAMCETRCCLNLPPLRTHASHVVSIFLRTCALTEEGMPRIVQSAAQASCSLWLRRVVRPNPSIERTSQRPLRALCAAAHVER